MSSPKPVRIRWGRWVLAGVALLVVGFLLGLRRPGGLTQRIAAIRALGQPTSLDELEQSLGADAAVGRRNAALLTDLGTKLRVDTGRKIPARATNTAEDLAWAQTQLAGDNAAVFTELHEHLAGGPWYFANAWRVSLDHLSAVKGLANALQIEAVSSALTGDTNRAATALLAGLQVGRTLESGALLIDYLVWVACDSIAAHAAEAVFSRLQLNDAQLEALQKAFRRAEGTNALGRALIGERAYGLASLRGAPGSAAAAARGPGGPLGGGAEVASNAVFGSFYRIFLQPGDLTYYLDQMERLIANTALSGPDARVAQRQLESDFRTAGGPWRRPLSRMTLPALFKSAEKERRHIAIQRCARTGCAVERFRAVNGHLPATLDELVPELLEAVPSDPMTGHPLKYRRLDRGYVIYSIGEDDADDSGAEQANRVKGAKGGWDYTFTVER